MVVKQFLFEKKKRTTRGLGRPLKPDHLWLYVKPAHPSVSVLPRGLAAVSADDEWQGAVLVHDASAAILKKPVPVHSFVFLIRLDYFLFPFKASLKKTLWRWRLVSGQTAKGESLLRLSNKQDSTAFPGAADSDCVSLPRWTRLLSGASLRLVQVSPGERVQPQRGEKEWKRGGWIEMCTSDGEGAEKKVAVITFLKAKKIENSVHWLQISEISWKIGESISCFCFYYPATDWWQFIVFFFFFCCSMFYFVIRSLTLLKECPLLAAECNDIMTPVQHLLRCRFLIGGHFASNLLWLWTPTLWGRPNYQTYQCF